MSREIVEYREVKYECDRCESKVTSVLRKTDMDPRLPNGWLEIEIVSSNIHKEKYHFCVMCRNSFTEWRHQIRDEIVEQPLKKETI